MVRIRSRRPKSSGLRLVAKGASADIVVSDVIEITGATPEQIGTRAAELGIAIFETTTEGAELEDMFF